MLSILTNTGAADAVRALNAATAEVQVHQERIATGKRVNSTKDDSAAYITAQQLRSDADGRRAIGKSMANAGSMLDVANLGAEQISNILNSIRDKALSLTGNDAGSKDSIAKDVKALVDQINTIAKNSNLNGINLLTGRPASVTTTKTVTTMSPSAYPPPTLPTMAALPPGSTLTSNGTGSTLQTVTTDAPSATAGDPELAAKALGTPPENASASYTVSGGQQAGRMDVAFNAFGEGDVMEVWQNGTRIAATGQNYAAGCGAVSAGKAVSGETIVSFDYDPSRGDLTFRFNPGGADSATAWAVTGVALNDRTAPIASTSTSATTSQAKGAVPINYDVSVGLKGEKISIGSRDLSTAGLGLDSVDWLGALGSAIGAVDGAKGRVNEALSHFGTRARSFDIASLFNTKLGDVLDIAVGNIVDADLGVEAAKLQSAQIKQQLAAKALSIANDQPKILLSLFDKKAA
jgi:flagellin-like hook-associated protein FlgL